MNCKSISGPIRVKIYFCYKTLNNMYIIMKSKVDVMLNINEEAKASTLV